MPEIQIYETIEHQFQNSRKISKKMVFVIFTNTIIIKSNMKKKAWKLITLAHHDAIMESSKNFQEESIGHFYL